MACHPVGQPRQWSLVKLPSALLYMLAQSGRLQLDFVGLLHLLSPSDEISRRRRRSSRCLGHRLDHSRHQDRQRGGGGGCRCPNDE
jgi:hypothetical protein